MLNRLWLTDDQAKTLARAIRSQIQSLYKCADEMHADRAYDLEEKYVEEANALDEILDIIDKED